jgi:hypothetical protein
MHNIANGRLAASLFCLAIAAPVAAQRSGSSGGTTKLSERVEITYQQSYTESPSAGRADWMRFIVLWRGQPGWQRTRTDPAARAESERVFREASAAATLANRSLMGLSGGAAPFWAELDRENNQLYVLGNQYAIPQRDSTLVILVDRIDGVGGPSFVVGAAVIDGHMSSDFVPKTWVSGDTTFTVRPSKTGLDMFLESLKKDPAIAAFLQ